MNIPTLKVAYVLLGLLSWCIAYGFIWFWYSWDALTLLSYFVAVAVVLGALAYFAPWCRHLVPLWGEYLRVRRLYARKQGNQWLRDVGLIPRGSEEDYKAFMETVGGNKRLTLINVPVSDADLQAKAGKYMGNFGAKRFHYERLGEKVNITWYAFDPLDSPFISNDLPTVEPASMAVGCMMGDNGDTMPLVFGEVSGAVISGMPGSGKSVSMRLPFLALDEHPQAQVTVLDCKGGADWDDFSHVVRFSPLQTDLENLQTASDVIDEVMNEMKARYADGVTQFWNLPPNSRPPFRLLVIDESQELFEASPDSAVKKVRASILPKVSALVKKGRASGVCVVLLSQKQTSDAIPTSIRDNATLKVAFRLATREAVIAGMGRDSAQDEASPLEIPIERRGGAVIEIEGIRRHVRFMSLALPADGRAQARKSSAGVR